MADTIAITLPENKATLTNCDGSDDEESEPSVLKIMIEKQASIEVSSLRGYHPSMSCSFRLTI